MIGGASWTWWIGFHVAVVILLAIDVLLHRKTRDASHSRRLAWIWTAALAVLAVAFAGWIAMEEGHELALQLVAGYTIEMSLSVDNLFVFLVLFRGFGISEERQHVALLWGIGGAIVLRGLFIAAGVTLLHRFEWITYIFGVFLLYAACFGVGRPMLQSQAGFAAFNLPVDPCCRSSWPWKPRTWCLRLTPFPLFWPSRAIRLWFTRPISPPFSGCARSTLLSPLYSIASVICITDWGRCSLL
jgi:hypothetical protein